MGRAGSGAAGADGDVVLDDPEGEIDGDALVAEEVRALVAGVGFQELPEVPADAHIRRPAMMMRMRRRRKNRKRRVEIALGFWV